MHQFRELGAPISRSGDELRFKCPWCRQSRGKPDRSGALYYNVRKGVGACWKCSTRVVGRPQTGAQPELVNNAGRYERQRYRLAGWTQPADIVPWAREYLGQRGFHDADIHRWGLRAVAAPRAGIVIPNQLYPDGTTDFFQIRYLDGGRMKYGSPRDAVKPLYLGWNCTAGASLYLCEGSFSGLAMAAAAAAPWQVVASYGKALSEHCMAQLAALRPQRVCVVYDGGEIAAIETACSAILQTGIATSFCLLPWGQDPNSITADQLHARIRSHTFVATELTLAILHKHVRLLRSGDPEQIWNGLCAYLTQFVPSG